MKGELLARGRTAEVLAWKNGQVLKLFVGEYSAKQVAYEARVTDAIYKAGLPAPAVGGVVEVEGRQGIILERVDGPSMLQAFRSRPWRSGQLGRMQAELHAALHSCELPWLPSLREDIRSNIQSQSKLPDDTKRTILNQLEQLPDGNTVCHRDFHPDNILMSSQGPVVIDWANSRRGDPLADVAASSLLLRLAPVPQFMPGKWLISIFRAWFHSAYLKRYLELRPVSRDRISAWELPLVASRIADNIPEEEELILAFLKKALLYQ